MQNHDTIFRLIALGPLPDGGSSQADHFPFRDFDNLIQELVEPISQEHALALINLGPPVDTCAFEVEWALVHAVETLSDDDLSSVLTKANNTEVKRIVEIRLANAQKQH